MVARSFQIKVILLLLTSFVFIANALSVDQILVTPDGEGYLEIAKQIAEGTYWSKLTKEQLFNSASSIRTPIYPYLIYFASVIFGELPKSILALHWALAICVTLLVSLTLRQKVPIIISLIVMTCATIINSYLAYAVLTEWCGFLGCMILFALIFKTIELHSPIPRFLLGLHCAGLVLLKPVFLLPAGVLILALQLRKGPIIIRAISILAFALPLLAWCSFNWSRQETFSISPYGKFNLFGVAALSGNALIEDQDKPILKEFIAFANENKFPAVGQETTWMEDIIKNYRLEKYDHNLWQVGDKFRRRHNLSRSEINYLCGVYATRAILSNPLNYLRYIQAGVCFGWIGYAISLATLAISIWVYLYIPDLLSIAIASAGIAVCHILAISAGIATITWLPRYEWMTGTPVLVTLFLMFFAILQNRGYLRHTFAS